MFNNLFGSPSRSYAQNHHRTPPKSKSATRSKQPLEVPLPPSPPPPESAYRTPLLSVDHPSHSPSTGTDTLFTPGQTPGLGQDDGLVTNPYSTFGDITPMKSRNSGDEHRKASGSRHERRTNVPVLEDFELVRVIGKGCAGRVMMVRHTETAKIHAMKAISKRSVLTYDELDHTSTEVRILKHFAKYEPNNPFIVKLNYAFMDKENIYFVMDFYPGGDLATQMEIGRLGHTRTRFYAVDITQGLLDLHRHGIIVRDLKPENILLNAEGHAVLADFGLSKQFAYRGDPAPITIPVYPGQPALPYWAGVGLGSVRPGYTGRPRIMVDRAKSFVGTAEYIAPEVIKRAEYSYAVDWWALGIIMVEGMLGKVPFRSHAGDDPSMLWDQILLDSWQEIFHDRAVCKLTLEETKMDDVTIDFLDGLLMKDPNYRLTEPCVVQHPFFYGVEWDMVTTGGYSDPDPLTLHPVPEYNLHYFPTLCLQETPSVDMTEHDSTRPDFEDADPLRRTPLNDELTYAMECRAAKEAFKGFEWSRDQADNWEDEVSGEYQASSSDEEEAGHVVQDEESREEEDEVVDGLTLNWSVSEQLEGGSELDMPALPGLGAQDFDSEPGLTRPTSSTSVQSIAPELDPRSPTPVIDGILEEGLPLGAPIASPSTSETPDTPIFVPSPSIEITAPPLSPAASLPRESLPPSSPQAIKVPSPRPKTKLRLPSGLPASGLSSSEIVSIPSPDPNSPTRLVRRHPPGFGHLSKPSVDTVHSLAKHNHRLSVDLHGTISNLGDEDWEKLETDTGHTNIPSLSNAAPVAFFTRGFGTLRRRPSAINTGGGYRRHKNSESSNSASGDSSPTKANRHRPIFNVKSIENTKKAFKTLKAFPRMISRGKYHEANGQGQGQVKSTAPSRVTTPTSPPAKGNGASVPNTGTASWFTTRRMGLSKSFAKPSRSNTTSSSASTASSANTYANGNDNLDRAVAGITGGVSQRQSQIQGQDNGVPRVELIQSPPVVWDLGAEDISAKREGKTDEAAEGKGTESTKAPQEGEKVVKMEEEEESKADANQAEVAMVKG